jgi:hypothetical protein
MEKELLFERKENTTSVNIKDFSPKGAMLDITLAGKISGKATGFIMSTHNILMKPDGTSEVDIKSIIFSEGKPIFVWGKVTGKVIDPTPPWKNRRTPYIPNPQPKTNIPQHDPRPIRSPLQPRNRRIQLQNLRNQVTIFLFSYFFAIRRLK